MRVTHTFAVMQLSEAAYGEIRKSLEQAGYDHAFLEDGLLDMHGIAVGQKPAAAVENPHIEHAQDRSAE